MASLAELIPELAEGYRQRYIDRNLSCEACGALATRGRLAESTEGELFELPLCDTCEVPPPWEEL